MRFQATTGVTSPPSGMFSESRSSLSSPSRGAPHVLAEGKPGPCGPGAWKSSEAVAVRAWPVGASGSSGFP